MKQTYAIAALAMLALLAACRNPSGSTQSYDIRINMSGNVQGDSVTPVPASGEAGDEITLNYSVASSGVNNRLVFSGTNAPVTAADNAGTGARKYTINEEDAVNGVITINAVFTHSDPQPHSYTIEINMSGNVQGDSVTASPTTGQAGAEITLNYSVANSGVNNRLVFSGTKAAIAQVDIAGTGTKQYTINAEDATEGVITINAAFAHSDKQFDTIAFADSGNETKTYGDAPFTKAITNTGTGARTITYSSSDQAVATVNSSSGAVTIRKAGTTTITATKAGDATYEEATARYTLTVTPLQLTIENPAVTTTKPYDGTTTAAVTAGALLNKIPADTVTVSAVAHYNSANAAEANLITVVYTISGADADNYIKPANYTIEGTITNGSIIKADGAAVSAGPTVASRTSNSITINAVTITTNPGGQIVEYAIATTTTAPSTGWQTGLTFSGLTANTNYYVFARSKENENYKAGAVKVSAAIRTQAAAEPQPAVVTIVNFEADAIGTTYESTKAATGPTVKVVADPLHSGQKSLQITSTTYNQAAIVPINLPYELQNYKSFSFRFNLLSSANLNNQTIMVYVAKNTATFLQYGFGNPADSQYAQFAANLLGSTTAETIGDSHRNKWTEYSITINNPGDAIKDLTGDIFVAIGINCQNGADYLFDDLTFTPRDDFVPPVILPPPPAPVPPATGAVVTGIYRNMFEEWGKTDAEITAKVNATWDKLFNGSATEKVYYEVGADMAYILDSGNNDVRSEGMSYGMMICVQLNKKAEFDRLWKWAKTYMYNATNNGKNSRGYFAWQCGTDGSKKDVNPAPDGEFYFVTSLLFASARWGDGSGDFNYGKYARQVLYDMLHRTAPPDPYGEPPMFNKSNYMVYFTPYGGDLHTDPSYHLPAFYEIWADELENDYDDGQLSGIWGSLAELKTDIDFYRSAAAASRAFFPTTVNSTTGLGPDYANFDGSPKSGEHADFRYDAWRIAMNIGMDYAWWAKDPWQKTFADKIQAFFVSKGVTTYGSLWNLNGTLLTANSAGDHSPGLVACNAVASLAATHENAWKFIENFWNVGMTTGQYRYYDGCLYMLGLLHVSGNFKAYLSNTTPSASISPTTAVFDKKTEEQADITVTITPNGNNFVSVKNGAAALASGTDYSVSGNTVTIKKTYLAAQPVGTTTLTFAFSAGKTRNIVITVKDTTGGGGGGGTLLKYDSTNWPLASNITVTDSNQLAVSIVGGALHLVKTGGNSTPKFILTFNVGSGNLFNYSEIKVRIKAISGDGNYKDVKTFVGADYNTELGSRQVNLTVGGTYQDASVPVTHASANTYTGDVNIAFAVNNTTALTYEVASIELIPK